ncbi:brat protein-like protein [Euroglyphus maynei]|uniref:Brat protein-like protein n=1 Tax=Euroglyphus maynei TaxID=6958 RepID=A0A1Y3AV02_EURMA|nr:brat protein-like protein [Euroglyphus maynei]
MNDSDNNQKNNDRTSMLMQDMFASLQLSDVTSTSANESLFHCIPPSSQASTQSRARDFQTGQLNLPCCDFNDHDLFSTVPLLTTIPCVGQDYPFLHKIFQTLFANKDFIDCAFFDCIPQDHKSHLSEQMLKSKSFLYQLIIQQLAFDGHGEIAHALVNKLSDPIDISILQQPKDTLYKFFNIMFYMEIRSKTDSNFSNFLNWFLSNNVDTGCLSSQISSVNPSTSISRSESGSSNHLTSIPPSFSHPTEQFGTDGATNLSNSQLYRPLDLSSIIYETESDGLMSLSLNEESVGRARQLQVAYKFGQIGTGPGCLDTPHGFCLGPNDDIVIADTNNHRICVFEFNGKFKFSFGEYGTEPGKLHQPRKIAMLPPAILRPIDKPIYVVCDRGSKRSRMQVFSINGDFIRLIDMPPMDIVSGLNTTQDRRIIVVDSVRSGLIVMDEFGVLLNWFTCSPHMMEPSDITFHNKHFYICDFKGHNICVFNAHGHLVRRLSAKMLRFPNGIDVSDFGDIICGDSHGNRFHISIFNDQGQLLADYDCPFVKVSRCCGLRLSKEGFIVTLAKNNNHAVVMNAITIGTTNADIGT